MSESQDRAGGDQKRRRLFLSFLPFMFRRSSSQHAERAGHVCQGCLDGVLRACKAEDSSTGSWIHCLRSAKGTAGCWEP